MQLMNLVVLVCALQMPGKRTHCLRSVDRCAGQILSKADMPMEQVVAACYFEHYGTWECERLINGIFTAQFPDYLFE
jgi:hypothetical protein